MYDFISQPRCSSIMEPTKPSLSRVGMSITQGNGVADGSEESTSHQLRADSRVKSFQTSPTRNDDCPKTIGQQSSLSERFSRVQ